MTARMQFARYAIVGLSSNLALYLLYLAATATGIGHKSAMTIVYVLGVLVTFLFNRSWTFRHGGAASKSLPRYIVAYVGGYGLNYALLWLGVDFLHLPHQAVQAVAIAAVAVMLFLTHRYWVFPSTAPQRSVA